jgi:hypothetical protein
MAKKIKEIEISNDEGQIMTVKWNKDGILFQIDDQAWLTDDPGEVCDAIDEVSD